MFFPHKAFSPQDFRAYLYWSQTFLFPSSAGLSEIMLLPGEETWKGGCFLSCLPPSCHLMCIITLQHLTSPPQRMVAGEAGFQVSLLRKEDEAGLKGKAFYYDPVHPDGNTGAR